MAKKDTRLIIYEKMNELIFYSKNLLNKYPKSERFDLCADIKNILYSILSDIIWAWKEFSNEDKAKYLKKVDVNLIVLKSYVTLSYRYKYISQKNYMVWNEYISEIGKLIGAWLKSCQRE